MVQVGGGTREDGQESGSAGTRRADSANPPAWQPRQLANRVHAQWRQLFTLGGVRGPFGSACNLRLLPLPIVCVAGATSAKLSVTLRIRNALTSVGERGLGGPGGPGGVSPRGEGQENAGQTDLPDFQPVVTQRHGSRTRQ